MNKKQYTIHLLGHDIDVKVNMSTIIAYEEITGTSFYGEAFDSTKTRYALLAAIVATSDAPKDMADRLLTDVTPKEFTAAFEPGAPLPSPQDVVAGRIKFDAIPWDSLRPAP